MRRIKWSPTHLGGGMFFPVPFSQCRSSQLQSQAGIAMGTNDKRVMFWTRAGKHSQTQKSESLENMLAYFRFGLLALISRNLAPQIMWLGCAIPDPLQRSQSICHMPMPNCCNNPIGLFCPVPAWLGSMFTLRLDVLWVPLFLPPFDFGAASTTSSGFLMAGVIKKVKGKNNKSSYHFWGVT